MRLSALIITAIFLGVVSAACSPAAPFRPSLIGQTFSTLDDCYRPGTGSRIDISSNSFTYKPYVLFRAFQCDETYIFDFSSDKPTITFIPQKTHFESLSTAENDEFCRKHANKTTKVFRPSGSTKRAFFKSVKRIISGLSEIKEFECYTDPDGFITQKPGPNFANVAVDGIITYLIGVGYEYNVCVGKNL